ncbi:Putative Co/Zn/Cd efflux system membrane fusion protein [Minicystis rosea]|nr:Putative Co/Zn/Cd efflux system membrane fusion protein [Minicystis rosea]
MKSLLFRPSRATVVIALAAALAGCKKSQAAPAERATEAIDVETTEVRAQPMPRSLRVTGSLRGKQQTDLAANAVGRVLKTFVERGTEVKQGDLLATLDIRGASLTAAEARANAALARANAETAKRECERYQKLLQTGAVSPAEYDRMSDSCRNAPLSIEAAQARANAASLVVGDGSIRAPFNGVIIERYVDEGEYVRADSKVVTLVQLDALRLELTVPEQNLSSLKDGGPLTFTVPAYPDREFTGTVRFISAAVRETTRDLVAEAVVDNPDRALRPGMFATVALMTGEVPAPVVPKSALVTKEGLVHVFAVVNQRIEERVVQLGATKGDVVAVTRGLATGDRIITKPAPTMQNGQAVR